MKAKAIWQFYYVVVLLALAFGPIISSLDWGPWNKHYVGITNNLNNTQLDYRCRSGDDDLGRRSLASNEYWEFGFRLGLTTLFYCDMWYSNYHVHFDAFINDSAFTGQCGGAHCKWTARETGISLYHNRLGEFEKKYDWVKN